MRRPLLVTLLLALLATAQAAAQSAPVVTLVKAARLLDPRTGKVLTPAAVLVENDRISEVGSPSQVQAHAPAAVRTIDLGGATMSPGARVLLGAQLAREDLESGFTTVRNLGHSGIDGDVALRDAINAGRVPGPRMLATGRKLIAPGAYLQSLNAALAEPIVQQEFLTIDRP